MCSKTLDIDILTFKTLTHTHKKKKTVRTYTILPSLGEKDVTCSLMEKQFPFGDNKIPILFYFIRSALKYAFFRCIVYLYLLFLTGIVLIS